MKVLLQALYSTPPPKTFSAMMNRNGDSGHHGLVLNLREKAFIISPVIINCRFSEIHFYQINEVPFYS